MDSESSVQAGPTPRDLPTVPIMGIRIHALTEERCIAHVVDELRERRGGWIVTPNLDHLRRLCQDTSFRGLCAKASLLVPDGIPLLWAARLQRTPLPGRVAGSDLIWSLNNAAARAGHSVFLLGGDPGTAEGAAAVLKERHPSIRIVGIACPPIGFDKNEAQMEQLVEKLGQAAPDIVFVALGSPKQEMLIERLRSDLPATWWLGIGISFSFLCGDVKRAPRWMQRTGIEWIHRLMQEPRRLAARYLVHGLPFAVRLFVTSAWRGLRGGPPESIADDAPGVGAKRPPPTVSNRPQRNC